jgi:hypothetical protein
LPPTHARGVSLARESRDSVARESRESLGFGGERSFGGERGLAGERSLGGERFAAGASNAPTGRVSSSGRPLSSSIRSQGGAGQLQPLGQHGTAELAGALAGSSSFKASYSEGGAGLGAGGGAGAGHHRPTGAEALPGLSRARGGGHSRKSSLADCLVMELPGLEPTTSGAKSRASDETLPDLSGYSRSGSRGSEGGGGSRPELGVPDQGGLLNIHSSFSEGGAALAGIPVVPHLPPLRT